MKRYLTTTEYSELRLLVDHILSASSQEEVKRYVEALDVFRKKGDFIGTVGDVVNGLQVFLSNTSVKVTNQARLSNFMFADNYLNQLRDYVQVD